MSARFGSPFPIESVRVWVSCVNCSVCFCRMECHDDGNAKRRFARSTNTKQGGFAVEILCHIFFMFKKCFRFGCWEFSASDCNCDFDSEPRRPSSERSEDADRWLF